MSTTLHPPEFQEQLCYKDLELMQLQWPTFSSKVDAITFWSKFQKINHTSIGEIARLLTVLFPDINEWEAFVGRSQSWIQAMLEVPSLQPTVSALMNEQFKKQAH